MCTRKKHQKAPDLWKHCARGGTRTGFQPLQTLNSPGNIANPAQSVASTTRSEAQGVHIVHTLILPILLPGPGVCRDSAGHESFTLCVMGSALA